MPKLRLTPLQIKENYNREVRQRTQARIQELFLEEEKEVQSGDDSFEAIVEVLVAVREELQAVRQKIYVIIFLFVLLLISIVFRAL